MRSVVMGMLSKIACMFALFAFAAGPTAMALNYTHCDEEPGEHAMFLEFESAKSQQVKLASSSDVDGRQSSQELPAQKHVHCNPVSCHFTAPTILQVKVSPIISVLVHSIDSHPLAVHLESLPRPPSC